jgi:hypothetical protein
LESICAFDVLYEPLTNKGFLTTFFNKDGTPKMFLVTGALKVRLTNLTTGETLARLCTFPTEHYLTAS